MSETENRVEKRDPKGVVDKVLHKVVSRKLLVWGTATAALFMEIVPSSDWVAIALMYIGSQTAVDFAIAWRNAGKES